PVRGALLPGRLRGLGDVGGDGGRSRHRRRAGAAPDRDHRRALRRLPGPAPPAHRGPAGAPPGLLRRQLPGRAVARRPRGPGGPARPGPRLRRGVRRRGRGRGRLGGGRRAGRGARRAARAAGAGRQGGPGRRHRVHPADPRRAVRPGRPGGRGGPGGRGRRVRRRVPLRDAARPAPAGAAAPRPPPRGRRAHRPRRPGRAALPGARRRTGRAPRRRLGETAPRPRLDRRGGNPRWEGPDTMSQTVDRALTILPLLAEGPAGLEEVATRLGVHKSTALRLLRTMCEHGVVYRQPDQRYRLGARLFSLAQQAMESLDVRDVAHPHLARLNAETGHTVHLAVYEEGEVIYIDKVDSRYPVRMYSRIGRPVAITVAAVAKL